MQISIVKFKVTNNRWLQRSYQYQELSTQEYLGVFCTQSPQLVGAAGEQISLSPFFSWYLVIDREHDEKLDGDYLQDRLPLATPWDVKKCVSLINDAHFSGNAVNGSIHSKNKARGNIIAANAHIDGIGDIVMINKVHLHSYRISGSLTGSLKIHGAASMGWCYAHDAEDFMLEFLHV